MKKLTLSGCGTALLTPFCEDGSVDYAAYAASIDRQVAAGVHFLVPLGTTAETPALTPEEKVRLLKIAKDHAAGRPLLVGCGANSFDGTMANIRLLEPLGPDAFLVVVPYYNKPTPEGQYRYFKAVAATTQVPVVIYNVPGRTGANMTAATALRLAADCPNIIGIKEASGNYAQGSELIRRAPEGFAVLSGDDDLTFALMATGAKGVVSVASNIAPAEVAAMADALLRDDIPAARALHPRLSPLFKACFLESSPVPAKAAMAQLGLMTDTVRLPLAPASDATRAALASVLSDLF
ncbi:MAG: 4-hydroxy-tetrahydrodipicolinate synthase [Bacteroidales bacterium]|nr:4-hydroxy-tetrahydrodipicolinate synthase [Bacteroidales bacterium]